MKGRPLYQVSVPTTAEAEEAMVHLLSEVYGQPASIYTDARTGRSSARVYLANRLDFTAQSKRALTLGLKRIREAGLSHHLPRVLVHRLPAEDWAESWKLHFKPLTIGGKLLIRPSWSRRKPRKDQALVVLDPGLSFGTGQHPTTLFCLEQLVAARKNEPESPLSMLDAGCGSGILAIAAAKLGFARIEAFDFDPEAVRIACENAAANAVGAQIQIVRQDLTRLPLRSRRHYDVICANLISDLLVKEMARLLSRLKPGGRLVLAGILAQQFREVRLAAERHGLAMTASTRVGEWKSASFARRQPEDRRRIRRGEPV